MLSKKTHNLFFQFKKMFEKRWVPIFLLLLFSVLFFATRLPRLKDDITNPDGVLWHIRSEQFTMGIKYKHFEKTYQHYHPGVTLMWIVGPSVELFKQFSGIMVYNSDTFENFDLVAKSALVLVQFLLTLLVIYSLSKLTGFYKSFLVTSIFTFEPFFLANSRLLHLDVLSTLLVLLSLIYGYRNFQKPKLSTSILTGFLLAMSFLTKSICIGAFFYLFFFEIFYLFRAGNKNKIVSVLLPMTLSFIIFTFAFFPALWVDIGYYLFKMIFDEGRRVGMLVGHRQIFFGSLIMDGGVAFYPLVILMKISPFLLLGILLYLYYLIRSKGSIKNRVENLKNKVMNFGPYLFIFYLGYITFMTIASKKIDRYIVLMIPFFAYTSYSGYRIFYDKIKKRIGALKFSVFITILVVLFVIIPYFKLFPWHFTYTSPIFGSTENANKIIGQKPFGVGMSDLKDMIIEKYYDKYGDMPRLGFYDTQPMRAIYPNSKISDVRIQGPGKYDLLILGVNENIPEKVLLSNEYGFEKGFSFWINGLEYWRVFVRTDTPGIRYE